MRELIRICVCVCNKIDIDAEMVTLNKTASKGAFDEWRRNVLSEAGAGAPENWRGPSWPLPQ